MSIFPIITKEKQMLYETIYLDNDKLKNDIPCICGYYGRACRCMNDKANSMPCGRCTLSIFVSTVDMISEICNEKDEIGVGSLFDSDIYDIQARLKEKCIKVEYSYIENILDELVKISLENTQKLKTEDCDKK